MPTAPPRLCPSCKQLVRQRYCPRCSSFATSPRTQQRNGSTRAWRRLRIVVFEEQQHLCATRGCVNLCERLDHIVPIADGGTDDRSNLQGLCDPCHRAKTQRESRRQG